MSRRTPSELGDSLEWVAEDGKANLRLFTAAGFALADAVRATSTTYFHTLGFVTEEQGVEPVAGERREGYDVDERARLMADHPLSAQEGPALTIAGIEARYGVR